MVAGTHKPYRCQKCGALILVSPNGKVVVIEDDSVHHSMPGRDKPSILLNKLKRALSFSRCPQCGSLDIIEDFAIKT